MHMGGGGAIIVYLPKKAMRRYKMVVFMRVRDNKDTIMRKQSIAGKSWMDVCMDLVRMFKMVLITFMCTVS